MKFRSVFLLIAAVATLSAEAFTNSESYRSDAAGYMARAEAMYNAGNYNGAIDQIAQISRLEASNEIKESADYYNAMSHFANGETRAVDFLNDFLRKHTGSAHSAEIVMTIGNYYFYRGMYGEAMKNYSTLSPGAFDSFTKADLAYRSGYAELRLGNFSSAKKHFGKIAGVNRYRDAVVFYNAYTQYAEGEYDKALNNFSKVKSNKELSDNAQFYIAQILFTQGEYNRVISLGRRLLETSGKHSYEFEPELQRITGESLYHRHDNAESRLFLERYLNICNARGIEAQRSANYIMGIINASEMRYEDAIKNMHAVTEKDDKMAQSALLYLGQAYVAQGNYNSASIAFEKCMQMSFDTATQETAFFNYAVAQSSGSRTPFSRTIDAFEEFLNRYPDSRHTNDVGEYLCNSYITGNDYERALESINRIKSPSTDIRKAKQYVLYRLALSDFANGNTSSALTHAGEAAALGDFANGVLRQCHLALGDCLYRQGKYSDAAREYRTFLKNAPANTENYALAQYNLGYALFKLKQYPKARTAFTKSRSNTTFDSRLKADAIARIADTYYYERNYAAAEKLYDNAINTHSASGDYAMFQQAMMNGLQKKHSAKIDIINAMLEKYPGSTIAPAAMLEKAEAQTAMNKNSAAARTFEQLVEKYPSAPESRKGMLRLAITYKNLGETEEALIAYKNVVRKYPSSEEAGLAVEDMKVIYSDTGRFNELMEFIASVPAAPKIDIEEVDKLTFFAAEKALMGEKNDISKINSYLKRFPDGAYALHAKFYVAKYNYDKGETDTALKQLNEVLDRGGDAAFAEDALAMKANILMRQGHTTDAMFTYKELAQKATTTDNRIEAQLGSMRAASDLGRYNDVVEAANALLSGGSLSAADENESRWLRANAFRNLNRGVEAEADFKQLANDPQSVHGAKSAYYLAEYYFENDKIKLAENTLNSFIDEGTPHQYWLARAFILLSDVYAKKGKNFEAREYLESLKSNYPGKEADIYEMIEQRLDKLSKK